MPDIEMPNGDIVNFPDDMPQEQIKSMIASKFPEVSPAPQAPVDDIGAIEAGYRGAKDMASFGAMDELQAGLAAGAVGAQNLAARTGLVPETGLTTPQAYEQALADYRGQLAVAREQRPVSTAIGSVAGAIATPAGALKAFPALGKGITSATRAKPILAPAGLGAISGGVYGLGSGEGGAEERAKEGIEFGTYGAAGGIAGASIGGLLNRAVNVLARKQAAKAAKLAPKGDIIEEVAQRAEVTEPLAEGLGAPAYGKVSKALKQDLGADYEDALKAYKEGDISLIELNQSRSRTLAQGAAQYSGGKARAQEFFDPKVQGSYDRVIGNIKNNVSGIDAYYTNVDDLLAAGRAKAAPLYNKVQDSIVDVDIPQEVATAITKARRQFPSEIDGFEDNSVKVLDYAKRVLDDDINTAQRAGKGNLARSRTEVKNQLLDQIDAQVPDYKKARAIAGDYLSINSAMEAGRKALREDPEIITKNFSNLTEKEREAFQIGVGKAIRDEVGKVAEGANPFKRILGSPEKQARIKSVLNPVQYKNLEKGLRAEDRLFTMRNEILGGSPTAGKAEAKNLISTTAQGVDDIMQVPRKTMIGGLKMFFDGLDDKTATKVSEILYETDPTKKLQILDGLKGSKALTPQEKKLVRETYFLAADKFDALKPVSATAGGSASQPLTTQVTGNE